MSLSYLPIFKFSFFSWIKSKRRKFIKVMAGDDSAIPKIWKMYQGDYCSLT